MKLPVREYHTPFTNPVKTVVRPPEAHAVVRLPAPRTDRAEAEQLQLRQQLRTAQKFLVEEREERAKERTQYQARIALLNRASGPVTVQLAQAAKPIAWESPPPRLDGLHILAGIALLASAFLIIWIFWPPTATLSPVAAIPVTAPAQHVLSNRETEALGRFEDSVADVPRIGIPGLLFEVNRRLTAAGADSCAELSQDGGLSLVLSTNDSKPLLGALSRCSEAVERVTK